MTLYLDTDAVESITREGRNLIQSLRNDIAAQENFEAYVSALLAQHARAFSAPRIDQERDALIAQIGQLPPADLATKLEEFLRTSMDACQRLKAIESANAQLFGG